MKKRSSCCYMEKVHGRRKKKRERQRLLFQSVFLQNENNAHFMQPLLETVGFRSCFPFVFILKKKKKEHCV